MCSFSGGRFTFLRCTLCEDISFDMRSIIGVVRSFIKYQKSMSEISFIMVLLVRSKDGLIVFFVSFINMKHLSMIKIQTITMSAKSISLSHLNHAQVLITIPIYNRCTVRKTGRPTADISGASRSR